MGLALRLYESLTEAPDDTTRFRLIVDTIDALEQQWPRGGDVALRSDVRESELRLQKEIEQVRSELKKDIAELRADMHKEIARLRGEVQKDIAELRNEVQKDIANVHAAIERTKVDLLKWIVPLMLGQVAALAALVKLL
ncbi:coiled-coil domain-containing protein [Thiocapsa sp. UBA6158]|jgi:phenylalanyl-tRNA synthetase alpha subunit|uniref:coiled-coil domain-containing protein n=1 Tax=Thiocapsa sp. UBA6158 TaxID=1947692 RepID=UPI0025F6AC72|nr:coiled-coil domain-containing protein [Thiocapsa sp. UBA6158]